MMTLKTGKIMAAVIMAVLAAFVPQAYSQSIGSTVKFGTYPYEEDGSPKPIEWIVVETNSDGSAVLLSKYGIDAMPYNENGNGTTWANSSLRKWLNETFFNNAFSAQEKSYIYLTSLANGDNRVYRTPGGSSTQDRVFLLSTELVQKYFKAQKQRIAIATPYAKKHGAYVYDGDGSCWWWLRSPGETAKKASNIRRDGSGTVKGTNVDDSYGSVRAAVKVNFQQVAALEKAASAQKALYAKKAPGLTVSDITFADNAGNTALLAGGTGYIKFKISNCQTCGPAHAFTAAASAKNEEGLSADIEFQPVQTITLLDTGESRIMTVPVKAGLDIGSGVVSFTLDFKEANGFEPASKIIEVESFKLEAPEIMLASAKIDDAPGVIAEGNSNGLIEAGETVNVTMSLANNGAGMSKDTKVIFESSDPNIYFAKRGAKNNQTPAYSIGSIQPGDAATLDVAFVVKPKYNGPKVLPITMRVIDGRSRFNKDVPLDIALNSTYKDKEIVKVASNRGRTVRKKPSVVSSAAGGMESFNIPSAKEPNKNGVAVIVGVKDYKNDGVAEVKYAMNDAAAVRQFVQKAMGFPEDNIIFVENPTKGDMDEVFGNASSYEGKLYDYVKSLKKPENAEVFVYYAGHGAPDQKSRSAYFVPSDANPDRITLGGYAMETLYNNLARLPAKKITVVTDACFSGQSGDGKMLIKSASPLAISAKITANSKLNIFNASRDSEMASWYDDKGHGMFTYYFLMGLSGEADADKNGAITAGEMDEYISDHVVRMARRKFSREQHPTFSGKSDDVLAVYGGAAAPAPKRRNARR